MLHTFPDNATIVLLPVFEDAEVLYKPSLDYIGLKLLHVLWNRLVSEIGDELPQIETFRKGLDLSQCW